LMKTGSFETDTKRAEKAVAKFEKQAKETGKAIGIAFAAIGTAIAASVKLSINSFDELSKASQKIGVSTESLSALKYAADLSGVSFESLQTSIGKLSVNIENFREGAKSAVDTFNKIGLDPTQFATTDALLSEIADKFAALPDGAQKTALAIELFGKAGRDLIPFLNQGKDGIKQLTDEAAKLGVVISTQAGAAAEQFNDNLTRLNTVIAGFRTQLALELLPTLTDVSNAFISVITESINLRNQTGGEALGTDIAIGFAKLADILTVIPELIKAAQNSISAIIADIVLLKNATELLNPAAAIANAIQGTDSLTKFKNSLETRKSLALDAEKSLNKLLFEENNRFEDAVRKQIQFRIDYINQYAQRALDVQKAYINESVEVQQAAQRELAKNLGFRLPGTGVTFSDTAENDAARKSAIRSIDQAKQAADRFIESLKREAETLGFTSEELKKYEANQLKLTATQKGVVNSLLAKISAYKEEEARIKAVTEAIIEQDRLSKEFGDRELESLIEIQDEQERFEESIDSFVDSLKRAIDPSIELADQLGKLQSALSLGLIDDEEYELFASYLEKMSEKIEKETDFMKSIAEEAAKSIQRAFADFLFDPFQGGLKGMLQGFITVLRRMAAEALASQIFTMLGKQFGGGGGFLGAVFSAFGGGRASGGDVMSGRSYLVGENGPEMFIPRTAGTIAPNSQLTQSAPQVNVRNINVLDPSLVGDYLATDSGEQLIMNVLQRNRRALAF